MIYGVVVYRDGSSGFFCRIDWSFYPTQKLLNEDQIMSSGVIAARWENKVASDPPASLLLKKTTVEDAGTCVSFFAVLLSTLSLLDLV